jgi:hypothetical protein
LENLTFDIEPEDINIPELCPILGVRLKSNVGGHMKTNSPSLDRIIPELGYVRGNIEVISRRANTIKNDGTAEEHRKIADHIDSFVVKCIKEGL